MKTVFYSSHVPGWWRHSGMVQVDKNASNREVARAIVETASRELKDGKYGGDFR